MEAESHDDFISRLFGSFGRESSLWFLKIHVDPDSANKLESYQSRIHARIYVHVCIIEKLCIMLRSSPFRSVPRTSIDQLNSRIVLVSKVRSTKIWDNNSLVYLFRRELWSYCSNCRANQSTENEWKGAVSIRETGNLTQERDQVSLGFESCSICTKTFANVFHSLTCHIYISLNSQRMRFQGLF